MSIIIALILSLFSVFFTKIADFIHMAGDIFKRIEDLLTYKCMTRAELARCSGVSEGTIRNWKRTEPQACMLAKIAAVLEVSIDYLVNGKNFVPPTLKLPLDEVELLNGYQVLNTEDKAEVLGIIELKSKKYMKSEYRKV